MDIAFLKVITEYGITVVMSGGFITTLLFVFRKYMQNTDRIQIAFDRNTDVLKENIDFYREQKKILDSLPTKVEVSELGRKMEDMHSTTHKKVDEIAFEINEIKKNV